MTFPCVLESISMTYCLTLNTTKIRCMHDKLISQNNDSIPWNHKETDNKPARLLDVALLLAITTT